jgi:hypothetical protein
MWNQPGRCRRTLISWARGLTSAAASPPVRWLITTGGSLSPEQRRVWDAPMTCLILHYRASQATRSDVVDRQELTNQ